VFPQRIARIEEHRQSARHTSVEFQRSVLAKRRLHIVRLSLMLMLTLTLTLTPAARWPGQPENKSMQAECQTFHKLATARINTGMPELHADQAWRRTAQTVRKIAANDHKLFTQRPEDGAMTVL